VSINMRINPWVALVFFAALGAARDVWAKEFMLGPAIDPFYLSWFGSSLTWILFSLWVLFCPRTSQSPVVALSTRIPVPILILLTNAATLIAFTTTFFAIYKLNAYLNSIVDYGATPCIMASLGVMLRKESVSLLNWMGMGTSLLGIVILAGALTQRGGAPVEGASALVGIALALVSAVALAVAQNCNKELLDRQWPKEKVIFARLPLLVLAVGTYGIFNPTFFHGAENWLTLSIWAFFGMTIPLFLSVVALQQLQVKSVSQCYFLIPVFAFLGSLLRGHIKVSASLWLDCLAGALVIFGVLLAEKSPGLGPSNAKDVGAIKTNTL
jgi:drug/metabolite transporter (DMT)-like permease